MVEQIYGKRVDGLRENYGNEYKKVRILRNKRLHMKWYFNMVETNMVLKNKKYGNMVNIGGANQI